MSHGCVRVEDPVKLAGYVLGGQGDWTEGKIRDAMQPADSGDVEPLPVDLEQPVPYTSSISRHSCATARSASAAILTARTLAAWAAWENGPVDRSECKELEDLAGG